MARSSRPSKKLRQDACGTSRGRDAQAEDRDLVPGRGPHRPEERPCPTMGQAENAAVPARGPGYESAYLFGAICPARAWAQGWRCPSPTPTPCTASRRDIPARRQRRPRRPAARPRRLAHHRQSRLAEEHHPDPAAVALPGAQPGRAGLAIPARQLPLKPRLRGLRRHRCGCLRRMEQAHRKAPHHHINRNAPMGQYRVSYEGRWYNSQRKAKKAARDIIHDGFQLAASIMCSRGAVHGV